jgi:hypothetical protein
VVQAAPTSAGGQAFVAIAEKLADVIAERYAAGEGGGAPLIDRSGGTGKKRLPISR